jgi:hypothetical protein
MSNHGWIAVDLDGTLAHYDAIWKGPDHIGEPIPLMLNRVKDWLAMGQDVRIFTARVGPQKSEADIELARKAIEAWCFKHLGKVLSVTACKDYQMKELWDDRCVAVETNTGRRLS